jgi:hypothetical protein
MKLSGTSLSVAMLAAGIALAAATPAQAKKPIELHFGKEPWHLVLSASDLKPMQGAPSGRDRQVFTYANDRGMLLSVIVENAHQPATMASCRAVFDERKHFDAGGMGPSNEVQGQRGEAAMQEYGLKFGPIVQHDIFSCRVRGTYYIDVHASKLPYQPGDRDALMALVDAVTIVN